MCTEQKREVYGYALLRSIMDNYKYWQLLPQVDSQPMNLVYYFTPWGWQYQLLIVNPMGRIYYIPMGLTSSTHWLSSSWVGCTMSPHGADKITSFTVNHMGWILYVPTPWERPAMCINHGVVGWSNGSVTYGTDSRPHGLWHLVTRASVCHGSECVKHKKIIYRASYVGSILVFIRF